MRLNHEEAFILLSGNDLICWCFFYQVQFAKWKWSYKLVDDNGADATSVQNATKTIVSLNNGKDWNHEFKTKAFFKIINEHL